MLFGFLISSNLLIKYLFFWSPVSGKHLYKNNSPLFIAHRGMHKSTPENTVSSVKKALESGFSAIELDVFSDINNEIICSHNLDLERETEGNGFVDEKKFSELENIVYRSYSNNKRDKNIPLISTILKKYGNEAWFIIDVKTKSPLQLKPAIKIAKIIKEFKLQGSVIISSFNPLLLLFIKCIDSKLLTGFIFINPKYLKLTNLIHPDFLHPRGDIINKKVIHYSKRKNLPVNGWTVNNNLSWAWLSSAGVSGIITDEILNFSKKK